MIATRKNDENIMVLMGDDFAYLDAFETFRKVEIMIKHANRLQEVNMTFIMSTPSRFTDALKKEKVTWPVKTDDLFPYLSETDNFWTGYFSSRPALKK